MSMTRFPPFFDLSRHSHAGKDALIMALWTRQDEALARIDEPTARVAELEAKLGEPPKRSDNPSVPPSRGDKPNHPPRRKRRRTRRGVARRLHPNPDRTPD